MCRASVLQPVRGDRARTFPALPDDLLDLAAFRVDLLPGADGPSSVAPDDPSASSPPRAGSAGKPADPATPVCASRVPDRRPLRRPLRERRARPARAVRGRGSAAPALVLAVDRACGAPQPSQERGAANGRTQAGWKPAPTSPTIARNPARDTAMGGCRAQPATRSGPFAALSAARSRVRTVSCSKA